MIVYIFYQIMAEYIQKLIASKSTDTTQLHEYRQNASDSFVEKEAWESFKILQN